MASEFCQFDVLVQIYRTCGFIFDTDCVKKDVAGPQADLTSLLTKSDRYVLLYTGTCLKEIKFAYNNQYTVACAIISAARTKCGIQPIWPQEMQQLTGLQHEHFIDIESCIFETVSK